MSKLTFIVLSIALFIGSISFETKAQSPNWIWAKAIGGSGYGYAIAADSFGSGSVYTTGYFSGIADFDPGPGVFNIGDSAETSIFISKLDYTGNFVWAKAISGGGYKASASLAIEPYGSRNIYIAGCFEGTMDFDPGAGIYNLTAAGNTDAFIAKFDSSGNLIWAKAMSGAGHEFASVTIDTSGNGAIYVSGIFNDTVDFDPGIAVLNLTSNGLLDFFITKLDTSGNLIWAKTIGGIDQDDCRQVAIDQSGSKNIYLTGTFSDTVDFDPGPGVFNLFSAGNYDIFILKLDSAGNFVWAKSIGGKLFDRGKSIAVEQNGNGDIYATGVFYDTVDFDPGPGTYFLTSTGDVFVTKYDSSGNFIWAKAFGGPIDDESFSIAIDPAGNGSLYTTGYFQNTADFDPGPNSFNLTSAGNDDIFVSKLDSAGNFIWAKSIGGPGIEVGLSIAHDGFGNLFLSGVFLSGAIALDSITITKATNGIEMFVAKLNNLPLAIENLECTNHFSVYPNPATNFVFVCSNEQHPIITVTITDISGKVIYASEKTGEKKMTVETKEFANGIYFLQIKTAEKIETKKLIISK